MHVEVRNFVRSTWKLLPLMMGRALTTLRVSHQAVLSAEIISVLRKDHAEADKNLLR